MKLIVPPEEFQGDGVSPLRRERTLFLAGGISGCPLWQDEVVEAFKGTDIVLLNPRRRDFPMDDPDAAGAQIAWEHEHLRKASDILFWFPCETLCPIVLYELGTWTAYHNAQMRIPRLFIGCHPEYKRRQDVVIQTALVAPHLTVTNSLSDLIQKVKDWRGASHVGG